VYDQLIQSINTYSFALDVDKSGYILAIDNILGLLVLPLFGRLSDKCNSKYGRRTPFIFIGSAVSLIGLLFVGIFASTRSLVPYIIALFITLFAMAAYRSPGLSLVPDFVDEKNRSEANSIANLVSVSFTLLAIVISLTFIPLKWAQSSKFMPVVVAVILASIMTMILFFKKFNEKREVGTRKELLFNVTPPPVLSGAEKQMSALSIEKTSRLTNYNKFMMLSSLFFFYIAYNALVSNFTIYSDVILHFKVPQIPLVVVILGALPGFFLAIKLSKTIGRKYTVIFGYMLMFLAFLLGNFLTSPQILIRTLLLMCFLLAGIGYGFAMVNMYPFFLELSQTRNVGQSTGIFSGVMTAAMVLTPILAGKIITYVGAKKSATYNISQIVDNAQQTVVKNGDYTVLLPYCAVAMVCAIIFALLIKSKEKVQVEKVDSDLQ
ncbi:MAG: MFS transporter, partial [Clostridia bacterium]